MFLLKKRLYHYGIYIADPENGSSMLSSRLFAARVVKLVDTGDLKSPDHCDRAGSSPAPGTTEFAISLCGEAARVVMDRGSEGQ